MKKIRVLLAAVSAAVFFLASPGVAGEKVFQSISPVEAKKIIETRGDLLVVDVRSPQEYSQGALPDSKLIPFWKIMKGEHDLPQDRPILLVCAVGGRSYAAGQYLSVKGFREIYNLSGGLSAWAQQRVPLPEKPKASVK